MKNTKHKPNLIGSKIQTTLGKTTLGKKSQFLTRGVVEGRAGNSGRAFSCYNFVTSPFRMIFSIPVKGLKIVQENIFPEILFTEGYAVLRKNFGFSRERIANDVLLGGMIACTLANLWINPWLDKEDKNVNAIWYQVSNTSISDEEFNTQFYNAVGKFSLALGAHVFFEIMGHIFEFLLSTAITFKSQYEFGVKWLTNFSAYGLTANNISSGTESDEEKANLNPVKIFTDIENQELIVSLWNSRLNTIIDCGTALYALYTMSPSLIVSFFMIKIVLPKFIVLSFVYSMSLNGVLMLFEKPMHYFYEKMNHFKDRLIRQITNIDVNAELISFLEGDEFEAKKLLNLLELERKNALKYDFMNALKLSIEIFVKHFEWLVPIVASIDAIRDRSMDKESAGPLMSNYVRINKFLVWAKQYFQQLEKVQESRRRLRLYEERIEAWEMKRVEIEKKVIDSEEISFNGEIYLDENKSTLLAQGKFTLPKGSITHFDAPSGSGKTTLFRIFRGLCNFDGKCTLPKEQTAFLPSQTYVLGGDEPLFQTVCYPVKIERENGALNEKDQENVEFVRQVFKTLNLPERIYSNLVKIPLSSDKSVNTLNAASWTTSLSDGERKRVAFANILLKLKTKNIKFLVLDEPFKGIDFGVQATMVRLLRENIAKGKSPGCTVLFSNHEQNHGLNTQVLKLVGEDKNYKLEKVGIEKRKKKSKY